ncbi:PREDICTED: uncharacterized protein LOC104374500, partial [Tauraco erythrolophus]|uniref:uncharacterized protein LOC104374500 n=1 Tax=Tauraco erythrolophus TaxID=121530 RepID=UPI0005233B12
MAPNGRGAEGVGLRGAGGVRWALGAVPWGPPGPLRAFRAWRAWPRFFGPSPASFVAPPVAYDSGGVYVRESGVSIYAASPPVDFLRSVSAVALGPSVFSLMHDWAFRHALSSWIYSSIRCLLGFLLRTDVFQAFYLAIEEEGGNPDEIPVVSENVMKKTPKRSSKGRRPDEEGVEDNGLEEDSGDGQEDIEASLDNLQDIDMMDISVLDEAEIDNGNAVDCGEDYSADNILDSLSDSKENADAEVKELPDQPTEYAVGNLEASPQFSEIKEESREIPVAMVEVEDCGNSLDASSSDLTVMKELEELPLEP